MRNIFYSTDDEINGARMDVERVSKAWSYDAFPCNPIPFANGLATGCKLNGSDWIKTDQAKKILWILMAQAYGQLATIDLGKEWDEFYKQSENAEKESCPK